MTRRQPVLVPAPTTPRLSEFRHGRNFIRVGDTVRVVPSKPGKRDGGRGHVIGIRADDAGEVASVDVVLEARPGVRTFYPDRINRVAQSRVASR